MSHDRLLLDTHAFIWWRENNPRLRQEARIAISSAAVVYVSAASAWETSIKIALGKLILSENISVGVISSGFEGLPIEFRHAESVARLPPHHNDPFDRLLIVQAMNEGLTLVTHDRRFSLYAIDILWT